MTWCVQCMLEAFVSSDGADLKGGQFDEHPVDHFNRLHADLAATQARRRFLDQRATEIQRRLSNAATYVHLTPKDEPKK